MTSITVRLDEELKARLRARTAKSGRSIEEEAREILKAVLVKDSDREFNLAESIRRRIAAVRGGELELPPRAPVRRPPKFVP